MDSGLYKEIKDHWNKEYSEEGHFDIMNKDGTQVIDRVFLLDYLHELNTDFKLWKQRFKGKKLDEFITRPFCLKKVPVIVWIQTESWFI